MSIVPVTQLAPAEAPCPARVYIASLAPSGRPSVQSALKKAAKILAGGDEAAAAVIDWSAIRAIHVEAVRSALAGAGQAPATINLAIHALRGVARAAWQMDLISDSDYTRIRAVTPARGSRLPAGRDLARGDAALLFAACADGTPAGVRDACALALMLGAGLRRTEVVSLELADYDPATGRLRIRGKGNKERAIYLANGSSAAMSAWLEIRGGEPGALLQAVRKGGQIVPGRITAQALYDALGRRAQRAGLDALTPHDLRRTFVGSALDAGIDLATVQALAGHASPTTTARYDRRGDRAARAAAAAIAVPYVAPEQS